MCVCVCYFGGEMMGKYFKNAPIRIIEQQFLLDARTSEV